MIPCARAQNNQYSASYYYLCIIGLLAMFSASIINPLLSLFAKEIGTTGIWVGFSIASYWISRVFLEVPSGIISSKYGYFLPMILVSF